MANNKDREKNQGRKAQAATKIGRPRIIESPAETERLWEQYVTKCHDGLGHRETPKRKGETPVAEGK